MTVAEIKEARAVGIWIGSHSKTHRHMARLNGAEAKAEIVDSKARLEDVLGEPVNIFTFPYGSSTPEVQAAVQEAGFEAAYGIEQRDHQLFRMTRVDGVKAKGAGLNWKFRISGGHYRFRTRAGKAKGLIRKLKP
jgi:peptidoglycan/xylan/chitin deacetylase (PgdA/CDA1 family)